MNTRSFAELQKAAKQASSINDAVELAQCADELELLATREAYALAAAVRGTIDRLHGNFPTALEHYHRALTMCEELGDNGAVANVIKSIGIVYNNIGNYTAALEHFHRTLAMHEDLGDRNGAARVTVNIGSLYNSTGNFPAALEHFHRALGMLEELGERSGVASAISNIGTVHLSIGDYPAALEHFHRALAVCKELGDRSGVALVTGNIGNVHGTTGNYTAALELFHRALAAHEELGERNDVARVTGNIGNVHAITGNYPAALEHFQRSLAVYKEIGQRKGMAHVTGNALSALMSSGDLTMARTLLQAMDDMQIDDPGVIVRLELCRAELQDSAGNADEAAATLLAALALSREHSLSALQANTHKCLRDMALKRSDLAGYVEHNNEFTRITEEINGKEATLKMAMLEKQREIDSERRERDKERALLYGALPESVATRMLRGEDVSGDHVDNASVLFLDIVGFTTISDRIPPGHVVHLLKAIFKVCDDVCTKHGLTKIKTIGDSYLAVAGVPDPHDDHATRAALAAIDMMSGLNKLELTMDPKLGDTSWTKDVGEITVRIGLHCGPLVAGIVGEQRLQYDVWGDTVNVASRMESTGEPGRIHVSEAFKDSLTPCLPDSLTLFKRGLTDVKGKGPMTTYWLERA